MAAEPLPPPESVEEEEGGGPVKPFLEHLEDLRWTIIKVLAAVIVSMFVCLVAGNRIYGLLEWPLRQAQKLHSAKKAIAVLKLGDVAMGRLDLSPLPTNFWSARPPSILQLAPVPVGTNLILGLVPATNAAAQDALDPGLVTVKAFGPLSAITIALQLALFGGLTLAAPFVIFFIGQFVVPALHAHEKKYVYRAMTVGIGLFILGVVFAYFVIMQITLLMTVQFAQWMGFGSDEWRADEYVDFVLKMLLAVGISFQLPVVVLTLVKIGILDYEKLTAYRAYFIVANMVACAVITPSGDPFTMLILAVPVQILYEASVIIAWSWWRRDKREQAALEALESSGTG